MAELTTETHRERLAARNAEIRRLRAAERWTFQRLARHFGLSQERVRQVCGEPSGRTKQQTRVENALAHAGLTLEAARGLPDAELLLIDGLGRKGVAWLRASGGGAMTVREAGRMTGLGAMDVRRGMKAARTEDALLGACYQVAASLAVAIKGDRHRWNLRWAEARARDLRERYGHAAP